MVRTSGLVSFPPSPLLGIVTAAQGDIFIHSTSGRGFPKFQPCVPNFTILQQTKSPLLFFRQIEKTQIKKLIMYM